MQAGDTLSTIAAQLWGDSSLWYKIAEVNGLTGSEALVEGQPLLIPVGVVRNTNNATTLGGDTHSFAHLVGSNVRRAQKSVCVTPSLLYDRTKRVRFAQREVAPCRACLGLSRR